MFNLFNDWSKLNYSSSSQKFCFKQNKFTKFGYEIELFEEQRFSCQFFAVTIFVFNVYFIKQALILYLNIVIPKISLSMPISRQTPNNLLHWICAMNQLRSGCNKLNYVYSISAIDLQQYCVVNSTQDAQQVA